MVFIHLNKILEAFHRLIKIMNLQQRLCSEIHRLSVSWSYPILFAQNLVRDSNHTLPLLQFVLANDQIDKGCELYALELLVVSDEFSAIFIFICIIVCGVAKVVVAIDLLVKVCSFFEVC